MLNLKKFNNQVHQNIVPQNVLMFKGNSLRLISADKENIFSKQQIKEASIQEHSSNLLILLLKRNNYQQLKTLENSKWNKFKKYKGSRKWSKWLWIIWNCVVVVERLDQPLYTVKKSPLRIFTLKLDNKIFQMLISARTNNSK